MPAVNASAPVAAAPAATPAAAPTAASAAPAPLDLRDVLSRPVVSGPLSQLSEAATAPLMPLMPAGQQTARALAAQLAQPSAFSAAVDALAEITADADEGEAQERRFRAMLASVGLGAHANFTSNFAGGAQNKKSGFARLIEAIKADVAAEKRRAAADGAAAEADKK